MSKMLIIKLNRHLEIFIFENSKTELIYQQKTENGVILSLSTGFAKIWSDIVWSKISNLKNLQILFIVGQKAGFTDSRVVSIWINSLVMFENQKDITLAKFLDFQEDVDLENYLDQNLNQILAKTTWAKHLDAAIYTREPSIGKH